jgi:serine/threonine protein kinase
MPPPATSDDFLGVVRLSNQIDNARLDGFVRGRDDLPAQPRKLAALLVREGLLTLFQAEQFLLGKYRGFTLGSYRILDRLGTGGTGTVYLAEHVLMKRKVAVKVLPAVLAHDPLVLERFRREAQAAAALCHPNVVHVYDFRQEGPLYFLVMEHIDGPSLQQLLARRGRLAVGAACEYVRQAALGLQHAHEHGLVHRDVKPANLLVDASGTVKVLDLGLARYEADDGESLTQLFSSNAVLGTADYLSPEQALSLHDVDGRADVYSLGATLFALLVGRPPFHDASLGQKLMWHQTKTPERVAALRPEVPGELSDLVARMLEKRPDDRPGTAAEVAAALGAWASKPAAVRPSSRTMTDLRLPVPGASGVLAARVKSDTWVAGVTLDGTRVKPAARPGPAARPRPRRRRPSGPLVLAVVLLAGLAGGVLALVLR